MVIKQPVQGLVFHEIGFPDVRFETITREPYHVCVTSNNYSVQVV